MKPTNGWFKKKGDAGYGYRTIEQQLMGLRWFWPRVKGKSMLDVGCAEGALSRVALNSGASCVFGIDCVDYSMDFKRNMIGYDYDRGRFEVRDFNTCEPVLDECYQIVMCLAVLHKLKDPTRGIRKLCAHAVEEIVIRLPETGPYIYPRDCSAPVDTNAIFRQGNFHLMMVSRGYQGEWIGFYERKTT